MVSNLSEAKSMAAAAVWGAQEFGTAKLGNTLRTARLVAMGAAAAQKPHGQLNMVFSDEAAREAAYRFVENKRVRAPAITAAASRACLARGRAEQILVCATDGTSLSYSDPDGSRKTGSVGSHANGGSGIKVMSTIGMTLDGTPLGILDQTFWARPWQQNPVHHQNRPFKQRESKYWVEQMTRVVRRADQEERKGILFFNGDAEADMREVLEFAVNAPPNVLVSVRNAHNRGVRGEDHPDCNGLWDAVETLPRRGSYKVQVTADHNRTARRARMRVRAGHVTLNLRDRSRNSKAPKKPIRIGVVWAVEQGSTPVGEEPIEWLILTTAPIETVDDVMMVIHAYALRWRIEDFHKAWKTGTGVEKCLLGKFKNITRWAAILASVAIRIERIKHLARNEPELPACTEFSSEEIEAAGLLADAEDLKDINKVTMDEMVDWIAKIGGHASYGSRPPAGTKVLARGLVSVMEGARVLLAKKRRRQT